MTARVAARCRRRLGRATPSLSGFVLLLALRGRTPGWPTTRCCSRRTTTPSSTPSSAGDAAGRSRTPRSTSAPRRPGAAARTGTRRGSCWSTRPGTAPAGGASTGTPRASPSRTPTGCSTVLAARGLDVRDRVLWREVRTPADLERDTGARRRDLRHVVQRRPGGVPAPGERARRCRGCSWSAARRTRAGAAAGRAVGGDRRRPGGSRRDGAAMPRWPGDARRPPPRDPRGWALRAGAGCC